MTLCSRKGCNVKAAKDFPFCSTRCARMDTETKDAQSSASKRNRESSTSSERMAASGIKVGGELLRRHTLDSTKKESIATNGGTPMLPLEKRPSMMLSKFESETEKDSAKSTSSGVSVELVTSEKKQTVEEEQGSLGESQTSRLLNSAEERLISMSLVDGVLLRLDSQMARLEPRVRLPGEELDDELEIDRANAMLATANSMGKLIRLKVDAAAMILRNRRLK